MLPSARLESRPHRESMPRYLLGFGLAALLLFEVRALLAGPTNPAWLAAVVLTGPVVGIPAGIAAFRRRNAPARGPAGAGSPRPGGARP
ncbi:hypothetical protein [Pseudarthrobacter sp. WHRI 8279]|uniref:hypothetical protein n=1 Tax=Pseudarthrobacter sp. WHRI 8279 TaxID=3162566 RepID=UPI0032EFE7C2